MNEAVRSAHVIVTEGEHAQTERLERAIAALLAAATVSAGAKLAALRRVSETVPLSADDAAAAFDRVKLRSNGLEEEIRAMEGGGLSELEVARKLRLPSRESVRSYGRAGRIFAWTKGSRNLRYPAWQIFKEALLPGLAEVLAVLAARKMSPLATVDYFLTESDELDGKRPLDLLRQERIAEVLAHAARYGQHGA